MSLTDEQKRTVATWVAAGDNLSVIQKKLAAELKVSMTYMDVRFLVDDLNLQLKDPPPKPSDDLGKAGAAPTPAQPPGEKKGFLEKAKEKLGLGGDEPAEDEAAFADEPPASTVRVAVDKATLIPGAIASGEVTFSDGVTGKWIVDNQGRPGFTQISQKNYRPSPEDAQAFMQELSAALQQRGMM